MITLTINEQRVEVPEGTTILGAARRIGIEIPTLCYLEGYEANTSCMICMVEELNTSRLCPSCSTPAEEGMRIATASERVRQFRRDTLELLLSEHVGDCEAPCQRTCPAYMNIPLMIRQIRESDAAAAIRTIKADIPLPAVLGRICPAPCEKACNRAVHDSPVSICLLKRWAADEDLAAASPYSPDCAAPSGKRIAVVGAGPAGLSAAYYLRQSGHAVVLHDRAAEPGGNLRSAVPEQKLERSILDAEIERIRALGITFELNRALGRDFDLQALRAEFDAVVLATGSFESGLYSGTALESTPRGLKVDRSTLATNLDGVFAGGNLVSESRMSVRAVGAGKTMALSIDQYLKGGPVIGRQLRFNSRMGRPRAGEAQQLLQEAKTIPRIEAEDGFSDEQAASEAGRCLHCDCRALHYCRLRAYADEYGADGRAFRMKSRPAFERQIRPEGIVLEPGKCIKCGLCVQIADRLGEKFGFTFINRGYSARILVPFDGSLEKSARECAEACPTGAIAWLEGEDLLPGEAEGGKSPC